MILAEESEVRSQKADFPTLAKSVQGEAGREVERHGFILTPDF
jgi:hypothetical protein